MDYTTANARVIVTINGNSSFIPCSKRGFSDVLESVTPVLEYTTEYSNTGGAYHIAFKNSLELRD